MSAHEPVIYFDITDIIRYAKQHERVSGIQRVQINVITEIINLAGPKKIRGLAKISRNGNYESIDLEFLTQQREFKSYAFLVQSGALKPTFWPDKLQVKKHLEPHKKKKFIRAANKVKIYCQAIFSRSDLIAAGLLQEKSKNPDQNQHHNHISKLHAQDIYVALGAGWDDLDGLNIAHEHHKAGGTVVQMVHDLIPIVQPDLHITKLGPSFLKWLAETTKCVDLYLCVSNNTQKDLTDFLRKSGCETKTAVTPLAHEFLGYQRGSKTEYPITTESRIQDLANRPFVLCVGSIEIRKNGLALIQAWKKARPQFHAENPILVFAGRKGWMIENFEHEVAIINAEGESIRILENPTDAELAWMYGQCIFTVYPSLYEGWGLPVGESAWFNAPCLASSSSSIPEVCGDLVDYFNPRDVNALAVSLIRMMNDHEYMAQRRAHIEQAALRTWRDHAVDVLGAVVNHAKKINNTHTQPSRVKKWDQGIKKLSA